MKSTDLPMSPRQTPKPNWPKQLTLLAKPFGTKLPTRTLTMLIREAHKADLVARRPFKGFEYSKLTKYGRTTWWRVNCQPVFAADGTFTGYRGTSLEITHEREAEDKLRFSERMTALGQLTAGVAHDLKFGKKSCRTRTKQALDCRGR